MDDLVKQMREAINAMERELNVIGMNTPGCVEIDDGMMLIYEMINGSWGLYARDDDGDTHMLAAMPIGFQVRAAAKTQALIDEIYDAYRRTHAATTDAIKTFGDIAASLTARADPK